MQLHNLSKIGGDLTVVLQKFNQSLPFNNTAIVPGGRVHYKEENFPPAVWNGIPIFFASEKPVHPNHEALLKNSVKELRSKKLESVGTVERCTIKDGCLVAVANIWDSSIRAQAERGLCGVSTGFDVQLLNDGNMVGPVVPSHVLSFIRCGPVKNDSCGVPNDRHTGFEINNVEDSENQPSFFIRNRSPPEHGTTMPDSFVQQARQRDREAVTTIRGRGRFSAVEGKFIDWRPGEGPE